ncbi:MAG: roadblock/LC7 domain-containing protein [Candidatus Eiseniibacteriota bacterium]|nr:MAG: roadblock/LC7 domain-containing protein [Candidatus Eisenbacteria bacterium]
MAGENWALFEQDFWALNDALYTLISNSYSKSAMLIDRDGRLIANVGETPSFDTESFATLSAADLAASKELASMLGERNFRNQAHQGKNTGIYQSSIDDRVILVVLFDRRKTLGLVRLKAEKTAHELSRILSCIFGKLGSPEGKLESVGVGADFAAQADQQIDDLLGDSIDV